MRNVFYNAGRQAALKKLSAFGFGGMDYDSRAGVMMGHQEDSESDLQLRPEKVKPSSTATVGAQKIRGELGDNVNRAFDTHDSMAPQPKDSAPHTEYVG